jgi:hypothetical protein
MSDWCDRVEKMGPPAFDERYRFGQVLGTALRAAVVNPFIDQFFLLIRRDIENYECPQPPAQPPPKNVTIGPTYGF